VFNKVFSLFFVTITAILPVIINPFATDYYYKPKVNIIYIACTILVVCYFISCEKKEIHKIKLDSKVHKLVLIYGILIILSTFVFVVSDNQFLERFFSIGKEVSRAINDGDEKAGANRVFIWKNSIMLIPNDPLLGAGPDNFGTVFMKAYGRIVRLELGYSKIDKAHNEFLQLIITIGIPATIFFISLLIRIIKKSVSLLEKNVIIIPLLCAVVGYNIQALFNISIVGVAPIYFSVLGMLNKLSSEEG